MKLIILIVLLLTNVGADAWGEHDIKVHSNFCNEGKAHGCMAAYFMYKNGTSIKHDYAKSIQYYNKAIELRSKACNDGDAHKCRVLAGMYKGKHAVKEDLSLATKLFTKARMIYYKACNSGDTDACNDLGRMYESEYNDEQDNFKAIKLFRMSCDRNNPKGCYLLATMYENGKGIRQSDLIALKFYNKYAQILDKECVTGNVESCRQLGANYKSECCGGKDLLKAKEYYGKACDAGAESGCRNYAELNKITIK